MSFGGAWRDTFAQLGDQQVGLLDDVDRLPAWYSLSGLVAEICDRAGMRYDTYDVVMLEGNVDGLIITNEHAAFTHIRTLAEAFFFDPSNQDGRLRFIHRGGEPVMTIDPDHVLEDVDEEDELQRKDGITIPKVLNLSYFDLSGGQQPDMQVSDRSADNRSVGEMAISTPVILRTNDSKRIAVMNHKVAIEEQRGEHHVSLPDSYIELAVADVVMYRNARLRIFECEVDEGFQRYKAIHDRGTAYYSFAEGEAPPEPAPPIPIAPGPTRVEIVDTQPLQTADDALGYYIAISGEQPAWRGARIEFSDDGGENYLNSQTAVSDTIMGELTEPLGAHPREFPDDHNVLVVQIQTPYSELQSATLRQMMNRLNLAIVGDELINIGEVDEIEEGIWECRFMLRGRKGTPIEAHPAGTRFVLMERQQMAFIPAELYELDQPLTFRATSLGSEDETITTHTFLGNSQRERAVSYLRAIRDGNTVDISWQGTGRFGGRTLVHHGQYFQGYRVVVDGQTIDTADTEVQVTVSSGSHTVSVYQRNQFTGLGPVAEIQI